MTVSLSVNGRDHIIDVPDKTPLLDVLRHDLDLKGTRIGCGEGQCGACTVILDGRPVQSCTTPIWSVAGHAVTTIEGVCQGGEPGVVQRAFLDREAAQCGYCINGIVMTLTALTQRPQPARHDEIVATLAERHLCRCGAHARILRVIDDLIGTPR